MAYKAEVKEIIDGDTFRTANKIRLARVYAPEINTVDGQKAKIKLAELISGKEITYEQVGTSYDRLVAEVWLNRQNINDAMKVFLGNL